jgi:hypothetical protein
MYPLRPPTDTDPTVPVTLTRYRGPGTLAPGAWQGTAGSVPSSFLSRKGTLVRETPCRDRVRSLLATPITPG